MTASSAGSPKLGCERRSRGELPQHVLQSLSDVRRTGVPVSRKACEQRLKRVAKLNLGRMAQNFSFKRSVPSISSEVR